MKKAILPLIVFLFISFSSIYAQYEGSPNGLAFRWTWNNFQFPITQKLDRFEYTSGAELTYIRHLAKHLNLAVPLKIGKANLPLDDQGNVRDAELIGSLDALLHLKLMNPEKRLYPYLLGGVGLMTETENEWKMNPEFPVGLGLNVKVAPHFYLSAETQYRFDLNENRNQLQHALGIWMILGGYEKEEKVTDSDKDGIPDSEDNCPNEPGPAEYFGCPDGDGDGIADKFDLCPNEPGKPALSGCPVLADSDGDGVSDAMDRCPTVAGLPHFEGCPDTDNDGIPNPDDKCPNSPGPASNSGCPELKPEEKEVLEFAMKAVQFETGSARLLPESSKILDEIAGILRNYPDHKLRIGGHTDSIGEADENLKLSEKRAKACFDYIVSKGIAPKRIEPKGFGESKPIGNNMFAPGREKNRRVEFEIYVD